MAYNITLEGKNKVIAERMLKHVSKILDLCEIEYWLEGGTLLRIRRENRLLPWDNDVDLSMMFNQINKIDAFYKKLIQSGYRVKTRYFNESNNYFEIGNIRMIKIREKHFFGLIKGPVCVDIFIKYPIQNDSYWLIGNKVKHVPNKFYDTFKTIKFNDFDYRIPELTDEYLTYRYGNWQIPVKNWDTAKDDKAIV
jgi:phosphorylcholine metabolism protein LicD